MRCDEHDWKSELCQKGQQARTARLAVWAVNGWEGGSERGKRCRPTEEVLCWCPRGAVKNGEGAQGRAEKAFEPQWCLWSMEDSGLWTRIWADWGVRLEVHKCTR